MLPALLFILLSLCNAQWPLQNVGHEEIEPIPRPPDQPGYPYDDVDSEENNLNSTPQPPRLQPIAVDEPTRPNISLPQNLKIPGTTNRKSKVLSRPPYQPWYPYDVDKRIENIPNPMFYYVPQLFNAPERPTISRNIKLPRMNSQSFKAVLNNAEYSDSDSDSDSNSDSESDSNSSHTDEEYEAENSNPKADPPFSRKFPISSIFSKFVGNMTLSRKTVRDRVANLLNEESALRNDTDQLVNEINLLYLNLAIDESDNELRMENSYKYGMSVVLRFLFEFYRIFRKLSSQSTETQLRLTNADVYGISYDKAVAVMKQKKYYSPLELGAPVRSSIDVFKSILYESVIIMQTKCSTMDPNWKCIIKYLANLLSETLKCSNVWYHAFIHMLALEKIGIRDSFVYKIANLDSFKELTYFENIFDFIIEKIQEYREVGRVQLSAEAVFFTMLADLQENGLLDCISIDSFYN